MLLVVLHLFLSTPVGLVHGLPHAVGDLVCIENNPAIHVTCCPARRLREGAVGTEEPLLVGIQHRYQRYLRQVQSFAQQVDADQHIKEATAQFRHDLHPLKGLHIGVDVVASYVVPCQVLGQLFRHPLGKRGDQYPFILLHAHLNLLHQVVYLVEAGTHIDGRVKQAGGANQLIHHDPFRLLQFVVGRCGADEDDLRCQLFELLEA